MIAAYFEPGQGLISAFSYIRMTICQNHGHLDGSCMAYLCRRLAASTGDFQLEFALGGGGK